MASDTITNNLNEIISTKNEFKNIIRENGGEPGTVFSEYPSQIRSIISGGSMSSDTINTYISSYLDTYNFIDADELSNCGYVTASDIPEVDLSSYVTYDYLSAQGYVTSVPVIDENIVPKETGTYTLGDSSHLYDAAYTNAIYVSTSNKIYNTVGGGMVVQRGGTNICAFLGGGNAGISPASNNTGSLGNPDQRWKNLYAYNAYISNYNNLIWTGTAAEYAVLDNYTTYQLYLIQE